LIDFSMFGTITDPCLFTWEELLELARIPVKMEVELRVIENNGGIQPNGALAARVPFDLKDISDEGAMSDFFANLDKLKEG